MTTATADSIRATVATNLKIARDLAGLTPETAGEKAGVSGSYIRRVEKGIHSPTIEIVADLCEAYGTTLAKFFASLGAGRNGRIH